MLLLRSRSILRKTWRPEARLVTERAAAAVALGASSTSTAADFGFLAAAAVARLAFASLARLDIATFVAADCGFLAALLAGPAFFVAAVAVAVDGVLATVAKLCFSASGVAAAADAVASVQAAEPFNI